MQEWVPQVATGVCIGAAFVCYLSRLRAIDLLRRVDRTEKRIREYVEEHHARNEEFLRVYTKICEENRRTISEALGFKVTEKKLKNDA